MKRTGFQESLEVFRGRAGQLRVVAEKADSGVASPAEQASYRAGLVAMIDAKHSVGFFFADRAAAALTGEELLVILPLEPVFGLKVLSRFPRAFALAISSILPEPRSHRALVRAVCRPLSSSKIRIFRVSPPLPLAMLRATSFPIFRIFRVSFPLPFPSPGELSLFGIASLCIRSLLGSLAKDRHWIAAPNTFRSASTDSEPAAASARCARGAPIGPSVSVWVGAMGTRIDWTARGCGNRADAVAFTPASKRRSIGVLSG